MPYRKENIYDILEDASWISSLIAIYITHIWLKYD